MSQNPDGSPGTTGGSMRGGRRSGGSRGYGNRSQGRHSGHSNYSQGVSPPSMNPQASSTGSMYQNDPSLLFPSTPYTPTGDLFMQQALRQQFNTPPPGQASGGHTVTVASAKFAHFTAITSFDTQPALSTAVSSLVTQCYRTTNRFNAKAVLLRRIVDSKATASDCSVVFERFRHFRHPNLVPLHNVTQTQEFVLGSTDVILEYRFVRNAKSLADAFFSPEAVPFTETTLWSIACQLTALLQTFHDVGVPLRGLHHSKCLYSELAGRIYFSGLGLMDIAEDQSQPQHLDTLLTQDVASLGLLLLQIALRNRNATVQDFQEQFHFQSRPFTQQFHRLIQITLTGCRIADLCSALGTRMSIELAQHEGYADYFFQEASKEVHNGRLMKLLMKINFVMGNASDLLAEWNDSGEKFALRLFYNYLFNQVDDSERPRLDWGHVYSSLNKLDVGADELVQLISGENSTILIVSFSDLRNLLNHSFAMLTSSSDLQSTTPPTVVTQGL